MSKSPFADYKFEWDGKGYVIAGDQVMSGMCRVEEELTAAEVGWFFRERHAVPNTRIAKAMAALLNFCADDSTDAARLQAFLLKSEASKAMEALEILLSFLQQSALDQKTNGKVKEEALPIAVGEIP